MKRYRVVFTATAQEDILHSYGWGLENWGETQAQRWARELRDSVNKVLAVFPVSQPLAPESEHTPIEIRQIIVGRYRVLFTLDADQVQVLPVRGPFHDLPIK